MTLRKVFVYGVPVVGPLMGTDKVPSFDDIDKLLMALALIQGLLLSCLAGGFTQSIECEDGMDGLRIQAMSKAYWSFQLLCLAILFTLIAYAYLVYLIDQEAAEESHKHISLFWLSGGRQVVALLVVLTLAGASLYARSISDAVKCQYGHALGMDALSRTIMVWCAVAGAFFIHFSFRNTMMEPSRSAEEEAQTLTGAK
eukprot:CAMPEP_0113820170 /NCGR_PEP_ID=MMETSP0328-20130328/1106_1 /TAXON_ID=39455 /ORGANISM="Alexandrium minutum" /LENGTH=198 /DNA_ID=CAMNT_0000788105 /DNA_START=104 /DNA_END=700 /DNA_ORIENTATION=- /assembly_acc=CAM_ASM_000350